MSTLAERLNSEFMALAGDPQPVLLELNKIQLWVLLGNLQLALRHAENTGPSAEIARQMALALEKLIATTPALKELAALGWTEHNGGLPA